MQEISEADQQEKQLHNLPHDPLLTTNVNEPFNLPLTAFCYLLRRLSVRNFTFILSSSHSLFRDSCALVIVLSATTSFSPTTKL